MLSQPEASEKLARWIEGGKRMTLTHVLLHITMEWPFENAELSNLFEDAVISLPNGDDIRSYEAMMQLPIIDCVLVTKEEVPDDKGR
jgi:hypothetical protein